MKKIILILLFICGISYAQTFKATEYSWGNDMEFSYYATGIDSGQTSGTIISLDKYDGQLASYPAGYYLTIDTLTANDEIIGIYIQGKASGGSWVNVDTVLVSDTLNAAHAGFTNLKGRLNLNAASWVFPQYRPNIVITSASSNTCAVRLNLYFYKRD